MKFNFIPQIVMQRVSNALIGKKGNKAREAFEGLDEETRNNFSLYIKNKYKIILDDIIWEEITSNCIYIKLRQNIKNDKIEI